MSIAWTVEDYTGDDGVIRIVGRHCSGEQVFMDSESLHVPGPRKIPLDVLDEMRKLRDRHAAERIDQEANP